MSFINRVLQGVRKKGFIKYASNVSWMFLGYAVRIGAKFLVGIYIARYLGVEDYGLYSYAMSFALLFQVLVRLGFRDIVIRDIAKGELDTGVVISTVLVLKIVGAVIALIMTAISSTVLNTTYETTLILIASLYVLFETFDIFDYLFQARVLAKYTVQASIISTVIVSVIKFAFIILKYPLIYFIATFAFESLAYSACLFFFFRKNFQISLRLSYFQLPLAKDLLNDSWPLALAMAVTIINESVDKVMVKNMLDSESLGYYSVGMRLYASFKYLPFAVCATLFPAIINAKKESSALYAKRMKELYMLMFWMAGILAALLAVFAEQIVVILFTEEFQEATQVLRISAFTMIPLFLGSALNKYIVTEKLTKINIVRTNLAVAANLGLNWLLIPPYGIEGAAIATLVSGTVSVIIVPGFIKSTYRQLGWMLQGTLFYTLWNKFEQK